MDFQLDFKEKRDNMAIEDNTVETATDIIDTYGYDISEIVIKLVRFLGQDAEYIEERLRNALIEETSNLIYEEAIKR